MEKIKYKDEYLTLVHYKEPLTPINDGFGYLGCLLGTRDGSKVQCAICGKLFESLVFHLKNAHGTNTRDYKEKYQLAYRTALISENLREQYKQQSIRWIEKMTKESGVEWLKQWYQKKGEGRKYRKSGQPPLTLEDKNKRGTCPDQLLQKIKEVTEILGHTPSKNDFIKATNGSRYVHLIYKTFGSWSNALTKLGLAQKVNGGNRKGYKRYDPEELLEYLRIFYENEHKIPTETDCRRGLIPPSTTYKHHFGSLPLARERAGIEGVPSRWVKKLSLTK